MDKVERLRSEIEELVRERTNNQECKGGEDIICLIRDVIKILNSKYPDEDVQGFIFEWDRETGAFSLRTYPSEVFPKSFMIGEEKEKKLAIQIRKTKCESEEISFVCVFIRDSSRMSLQPMENKCQKEVYKIKFNNFAKK